MPLRSKTFAALAVASALLLSGCQSGLDASGQNGAELDNGDQQTLTIAVMNGWDEGIAASELWKAVLEKEGYTVNLEYADAAPVYAGLSTGDYDLLLDSWLPLTHKSYIDQYGSAIEDLGTWNDEAKLTFAVNESSPIHSIDELAAHANEFGNTIVGIEPGAGLTEVTQNAVIPGYGLEGMTYTTSSTAAMLTELKASTDANENIVVTLWRPHWAYDAFPIRDLEDPKGLLGDAEGIHSMAAQDLATTHPTLHGWMQNFRMDSDTLYSLENAMFGSGQQVDDYGPIVEQWITEHQDYVDGLTA